jgi:hypothetical protein
MTRTILNMPGHDPQHDRTNIKTKDLTGSLHQKPSAEAAHPKYAGSGIISPAELKKLRRCGSFDLSGPIIYQRL